MIRAVKTLKGEDFKKMENVLMKPGEFHMPGKKVMQSSDTLAKVVLIDGTPSSRTNGPKKGTQAL